MPELPEVETVRRGLAAAIAGETIAAVTLRREGLRAPFPGNLKEALEGARVGKVERRAKYLLLYLDKERVQEAEPAMSALHAMRRSASRKRNKDRTRPNPPPQAGNGADDVLILHLGMSGRLLALPRQPQEFARHDHMLITFGSGKALLLNDARRFGLAALADRQTLAEHPLLRRLGPEPLSAAFGGEHLHAALKRRKCAVKLAVMDQKLVVGVGNIYACEALFSAGIAPETRADRVTRAQAERLSSEIKRVLKAAIESGGSTLRDYVRSSGESGYFQHEFKVYGREGKPCTACGEPVKRIAQGGRSTFYCGECQRRGRGESG